ncbi:FHA domain-containing protein [Nocardioides pocheonensis]|uniref:FHA domain-containing protein n=1 Tax=Nocardioides pocheonensis TaxID=661485 RepID=A0A3N0GQD5_9ACTN|nr:FHA domain-containing protein [Nocardioides pocheonensis]RNM14684.1 FHA domain-containing protein [Nocardioides pocheonensis]
MAASVELRADLCFSADVPGFGKVTGELTGSGRELELRVSDPVFFAGRHDAGRVRGLAAALAGLGIRLSVTAGGHRLLELGATRSGWLHRRLTGSPHLRVAGVRGAVAGLRGRGRSGAGVLPGRELLPPPTLFPLAPTFRRPSWTPVTTTHDPRRGGSPRLALTVGQHGRSGDGRVVFPLRGRTTIGSDPSCDLRLRGLAPLQAVVVHDEDDELVLVDQSCVGTTRVDGLPVERKVLRTGNRVELGSWTLVYWRAEYADHGRPFGGRIGGELGHQQPQPGRHGLAARAPENSP